MSIKIMVDSSSDISEIEAKELGIYMVPMEVRIGDDTFYDGVNITPNEFYNKLIESDALPQTSLINQYRWEEAFSNALKECDELVVLTISSKLSGTYNAAVEASAKFDGKVHVIDTLSATIGERLLVTYAIRLLNEGKSASEIVECLEHAKLKVNIMAMVNTLEYLKKGGRISATTAFVGSMLSIKPVVSVVDGEVKMIGKAMGSKKANNLLNSLVQNKGGIDFDMPYGVIYSGNDTTLLDKYVEDSSALWIEHTDKIPTYVIGSTIGTHVGPGAIGVCFFEK